MSCEAASEYLHDTLAGIRAHTCHAVAAGAVEVPAGGGATECDWGLHTMTVQGDGNCLAHAISRSLYGVEVFYAVLRRGLVKELRDHREWCAPGWQRSLPTAAVPP